MLLCCTIKRTLIINNSTLTRVCWYEKHKKKKKHCNYIEFYVVCKVHMLDYVSKVVAYAYARSSKLRSFYFKTLIPQATVLNNLKKICLMFASGAGFFFEMWVAETNQLQFFCCCEYEKWKMLRRKS